LARPATVAVGPLFVRINGCANTHETAENPQFTLMMPLVFLVATLLPFLLLLQDVHVYMFLWR
jgi:hypothetical protein